MIWTPEAIVAAIQTYHEENGVAPAQTDFMHPDFRYPWPTVVKRRFGTWNAAIAAAGFEPRPRQGWPR